MPRMFRWIGRHGRGLVIFNLDVVSENVLFGLLASIFLLAGNQIVEPLTSRFLVKNILSLCVYLSCGCIVKTNGS